MSIGRIGILIILLASNMSFALHMAIFRGAQLFGAGFCIGKGINKAIKMNKKIKESVDGEPVQEERVVQWTLAQTKKCGVSEIPFTYGKIWAIESGKVLHCSEKTAKKLDTALRLKPEMEKAHEEFLQARASWQKDVEYRKNLSFWQKYFSRVPDHSAQDFAEIDEGIAAANSLIKGFEDKLLLHTIFVFHEMSHFLRQDTKRKMYTFALLPMGIQAACSATSYCFNKKFNIQPPKTMPRAILRASLALTTIPLKIILCGLGIICHDRYCEAKADQFSCEQYLKHAQSARGVEVVYEFWLKKALKYEQRAADRLTTQHPDKEFSQNAINYTAFIDHFNDDPLHPYPRDRAEMYKNALDNWNKNNSKDATE